MVSVKGDENGWRRGLRWRIKLGEPIVKRGVRWDQMEKQRVERREAKGNEETKRAASVWLIDWFELLVVLPQYTLLKWYATGVWNPTLDLFSATSQKMCWQNKTLTHWSLNSSFIEVMWIWILSSFPPSKVCQKITDTGANITNLASVVVPMIILIQ